MSKPKASDMVEYVVGRNILGFNWQVVKNICDMDWKHEWQRKLHIYRTFIHVADMVWKTYKDYKKDYKGS